MTTTALPTLRSAATGEIGYAPEIDDPCSAWASAYLRQGHAGGARVLASLPRQVRTLVRRRVAPGCYQRRNRRGRLQVRIIERTRERSWINSDTSACGR